MSGDCSQVLPQLPRFILQGPCEKDLLAQFELVDLIFGKLELALQGKTLSMSLD